MSTDNEKIPCVRCGAMILPVTARLNDGLCMPCKNGVREPDGSRTPPRQYKCRCCDRIIYFDGICRQCRAAQEHEKYLALTDAEIASMTAGIITRIGEIEKWDEVYDDFKGLFCLRGINTAAIAEAACAQNIFYPSELYTDASPATRDKLIALLSNPECDSGDANALQYALALQGDATVQATFAALEKHPLPWCQKLHVNPSHYARTGGWTFDAQGRRAGLVFPCCYALEKQKKETCKNMGAADTVVRVGGKRAGGSAENCPHCATPLIDLLTLDGRDERLHFLGVDGILKATACPSCVQTTEHTFCRYDERGHGQAAMLHDKSVGKAEPVFGADFIAQLTSHDFVLSRKSVNRFHGCLDDSVNTIGGMPNWVQDSNYITCPGCGKLMRYYAQLHWDTLIDCAEGTLFFEICTECKLISMHHQQT
jgi:hypothetical protein